MRRAALFIALSLAGCGPSDTARVTMAERYVFTTPPCEYDVTFPGKPEIIEHQTAQLVYNSAQYFSGDGAFRAECVAISPEAASASDANKKKLLRDLLKKNAADSGISSADITILRNDIGYIGEWTGGKIVEGQAATYRARIILGSKSIMSLTVASPSRVFPMPNFGQFLGSANRK